MNLTRSRLNKHIGIAMLLCPPIFHQSNFNQIKLSAAYILQYFNGICDVKHLFLSKNDKADDKYFWGICETVIKLKHIDFKPNEGIIKFGSCELKGIENGKREFDQKGLSKFSKTFNLNLFS